MKIDLKTLFGDTSDYDKKVISTLLEAIKENHLKDFDYIKFKQSVSNLSDMNLDEATSIKSAFATASTMGLTKESLLKTAHHYKVVLEKEREQFAVALKNQISKNVDAQRVEAQKLAERIEEYKRKIAQMEREMEAYQKKINGVDDSIAKAKEKIDGTRDKFKSAFDMLYNVIDEDILQIERLL